MAQGSCGLVIGGFIEFQHNFNNNGYVEFWYKCSSPGFTTHPVIFIDGIQQADPTVDGIISGTYNTITAWHKIRTNTIPAGNHTILFLYPNSGSPTSPWYIDEIEFWELY